MAHIAHIAKMRDVAQVSRQQAAEFTKEIRFLKQQIENVKTTMERKNMRVKEVYKTIDELKTLRGKLSEAKKMSQSNLGSCIQRRKRCGLEIAILDEELDVERGTIVNLKRDIAQEKSKIKPFEDRIATLLSEYSKAVEAADFLEAACGMK